MPRSNALLVILIVMLAIVSILPLLGTHSVLGDFVESEAQPIRPVQNDDDSLNSEHASTDVIDLNHDVPLIVGGTDGSGTRSVVCLLDALGVPMIIDDDRTLDVGGKEIGSLEVKDPTLGRVKISGWPVAVRQVLEQTRSADYDPSGLPDSLRGNLKRRLFVFWAAMLKRGRRRKKITGKRASSAVSWGFKAPASMLVLPMLRDILRDFESASGFRFIHVVRDGRDIAYSGNQSPVKKFYNVTFPPKEDEGTHWAQYNNNPEVRGIELWSLWNSQVLQWEERTASVHGLNYDFDFMVLHVEDLTVHGPKARQAAIQKVASFVGSQLSNEEICCLANMEQLSLGSHTKENLRTAVSSRFGKWREKATADSVDILNKKGDAGLKAFGYEPHERPSDQLLDLSGVTSCDANKCKSVMEGKGVGTHVRLCSGRGVEGNKANSDERDRRVFRRNMYRNARRKRNPNLP